MSPIEIGFLAIAVALSAALLVLAAVANRFFHDRIFQGLTPGLTPPLGTEAPVAKVQPGREYSGEVAVAFSPPRGLRPGLVGTIVDGKAELRDITATVVDLAVRGHLTIEAVDVDPSRLKDPRRKARDWRITLADEPAGDVLDDFEATLLTSLFRGEAEVGRSVLMSAWTRQRPQDLRGLQDHLYRQAVANGWYEKDPRQTSNGCLGALLVTLVGLYCALMLVAAPSLVTGLSTVALVGAAIFASRRLKRRVPRTALGTAAMVSSLGFKKYLATAEAQQFSFEEAAGLFSRYLPYALVFGVADHWAKVFGEVMRARADVDAAEILDALAWFDLSGLDSLTFMGLDALADGSLFDLAGGVGELADGIGGLAEGLGGFAEGVGDFIGDIDLDF